jgi:hypothetical protein
MKLVVIGAHLRVDDVEPAARPLAVGDLVLSGIEVDDDQPLGDRALLLTVAQTRAALLERATFIAIRYGFAVRNESDALAKCGRHLARWRTLLEEHRDAVEMTLKVAAASPRKRPDRREFDSGAAYLRALHDSVAAAGVSEAFRAAAEQAVGGVKQRWTHRDEKSLELAALVARADVPRVRDAGEMLKRDFAEVPFLLSGPWPLEVFADDDHE